MKVWFVVLLLACGSSPPPAPAAAPATSSTFDLAKNPALNDALNERFGECCDKELDAVALDAEGQKLMAAGNYADAEKKFIAAYNKDPKAQYCFDLCTSEQQLGKLQLALNACKKVGLHDPTPELKAKADQVMMFIRDAASVQGVELE